jgi:undecaprenyl phosphate N,N'-diacetylbacillosamine 1-phosphate transferase
MQLYKNYIKRLIDIVAAIIGLVLTSPLLLTSVIILLISNKGKAFFIQRRPGKNYVIFKIYKLKTMLDARDENGNLLPEAERIMPVGRFMRRYSLDEIPQLFNILKGDMSLVGPRPLLPEYLPLYNDFQKKRHDVKPGITGWSQINGRNAVSWDERFAQDIWYVDNISFLLDCKIIILTFFKVIRNEGGTPVDSVVMKRFTGNG